MSAVPKLLIKYIQNKISFMKAVVSFRSTSKSTVRAVVTRDTINPVDEYLGPIKSWEFLDHLIGY